MTPSKRSLWFFAAAFTAFFAAFVCVLTNTGESTSQPKPIGRQVTLTSPEQIPSDAVFLFWYGCPHCKAVEEIFAKNDAQSKFAMAMESGQKLVMIPVPINQVWELHARLFYALSHIEVSSKTHQLMMHTIQDNTLTSKNGMKEAISVALSAERSQGRIIKSTEEAIFADMHSDRTNLEISKARRLVQQIGLKGVPALLLRRSVLLELGNGTTYENFLPMALSALRGDTRE